MVSSPILFSSRQVLTRVRVLRSPTIRISRHQGGKLVHKEEVSNASRTLRVRVAPTTAALRQRRMLQVAHSSVEAVRHARPRGPSPRSLTSLFAISHKIGTPVMSLSRHSNRLTTLIWEETKRKARFQTRSLKLSWPISPSNWSATVSKSWQITPRS